MVFNKFGESDNLPRFKSKIVEKNVQELKSPFKSVFWAAGFSFSHSKALNDCPYESQYENLFFGEENL